MIRNLVRRLILWAVPELGLPSAEAYAKGGVVRPFQENQDTVPVNLEPDTIYDAPKLTAVKYGYYRSFTDEELDEIAEGSRLWDKFMKQHRSSGL